jgi:hypothetical protein
MVWRPTPRQEQMLEQLLSCPFGLWMSFGLCPRPSPRAVLLCPSGPEPRHPWGADKPARSRLANSAKARLAQKPSRLMAARFRERAATQVWKSQMTPILACIRRLRKRPLAWNPQDDPTSRPNGPPVATILGVPCARQEKQGGGDVVTNPLPPATTLRALAMRKDQPETGKAPRELAGIMGEFCQAAYPGEVIWEMSIESGLDADPRRQRACATRTGCRGRLM